MNTWDIVLEELITWYQAFVKDCKIKLLWFPLSLLIEVCVWVPEEQHI